MTDFLDKHTSTALRVALHLAQDPDILDKLSAVLPQDTPEHKELRDSVLLNLGHIQADLQARYPAEPELASEVQADLMAEFAAHLPQIQPIQDNKLTYFAFVELFASHVLAEWAKRQMALVIEAKHIARKVAHTLPN